MIELKNVTRRFGDTVAVDGIDLTIETGEVCVLVGSSGCGKSTTLRMINRLLPHSSGEIRVDGKDITTLNPVHAGSCEDDQLPVPLFQESLPLARRSGF